MQILWLKVLSKKVTTSLKLAVIDLHLLLNVLTLKFDPFLGQKRQITKFSYGDGGSLSERIYIAHFENELGKKEKFNLP